MWSATALLILCASVVPSIHCIEELNATESDRVSAILLEFVQLNLAQRVSFHTGLAEEKSVGQLLDSESGRDELKKIGELATRLIKSALPKNATSQEFNVYRKHIFSQGQLFIKEFSTSLSSGFVKLWPKYWYDPIRNLIKVWQEVISVEQLSGEEPIDDLGPSVPFFPKLDLAKEYLSTKPDDLESSPAWALGTTPGVGGYKLNHVIPLPVLKRFYELFSCVWNVISSGKQKMLMAPFRVLKATAKAAQLIAVGRALNSPDFRGDNYDDLKTLFSHRYNFDYDVKKYYFWARGNLYWGYVDPNKSNAEEEAFEPRTKVILGHERFKRAQNIYIRLIDFMDRVEWTSEVYKRDHNMADPMRERIVQKIKGQDSLFTEMKDLLFHFVYFGLELDEPYPFDEDQWERKQVGRESTVWVLKSMENDRIPEDLGAQKEEASGSLGTRIVEGVCHLVSGVLENAVAMYTKYKKLEYTLMRDIVSDQKQIMTAIQKFREKDGRPQTTLSLVNDYLRERLEEEYFKKKCPSDSGTCATPEWCQEGNRGITLMIDSPSGQSGPALLIKASDFVSSTSFPDYCSGKRFKDYGKITTSSAVVRLLTAGHPRPGFLNATSYNKFYVDYQLDQNPEDDYVTFFDYMEAQLQKPNSTASKTLNSLCETTNSKSSQQGETTALPSNHGLQVLPNSMDKDAKFLEGLCGHIIFGHIMSILPLGYCVVNNHANSSAPVTLSPTHDNEHASGGLK